MGQLAETLRSPLFGFRISPNQAAQLIEAKLGVLFNAKPSLIESTRRNKFVHCLKKGIVGFAFFPEPPSPNGNKTDAYYVPSYNAYFAEPGTMQWIHVHENTHHLIGEINPKFYDETGKLDLALFDRMHGKPSRSPVDAEKVLTYVAVGEGLACWVGMLVEGFDTTIGKKLTRLLLQGSSESIEEPTEINDRLMGDSFKSLRKAADIYTAALKLSRLGTWLGRIRAEQALNGNVVYQAGFYFVQLAVEAMRQEGMCDKDIFMSLTKNPPDTYKQLQNPQQFARTLIDSGFAGTIAK